MEDYIYVLSGAAIMAISCFLQYYIGRNLSKMAFLLPLVYAILTFWLGFISLLFAFVLIFINEWSHVSHKEELPKQSSHL